MATPLRNKSTMHPRIEWTK